MQIVKMFVLVFQQIVWQCKIVREVCKIVATDVRVAQKTMVRILANYKIVGSHTSTNCCQLKIVRVACKIVASQFRVLNEKRFFTNKFREFYNYVSRFAFFHYFILLLCPQLEQTVKQIRLFVENCVENKKFNYLPHFN